MGPKINILALFAGLFGSAPANTSVRCHAGRSRTRLEAKYRQHAKRRRELALKSKRRNRRHS